MRNIANPGIVTPNPALTYLPGIAQGGAGWGTSLQTLTNQMYAYQIAGVQFAYYPYDGQGGNTPTTKTDPTQFAADVLFALGLGPVNVVVHVDNGNQENPWSDPATYLADVQTMLTALASAISVGSGLRKKLSITVGNENLPTTLSGGPVGANPWTYAAILNFYQTVFTTAVGYVNATIPGAEPWVPLPGDSGAAWTSNAMANLPASMVVNTGARRAVSHYPCSSLASELPGTPFIPFMDSIVSFYGMSLVIGEMGWELDSNAQITQTIQYAALRGFSTFGWEAYEPGGTQILGNAPVIAAYGLQLAPA